MKKLITRYGIMEKHWNGYHFSKIDSYNNEAPVFRKEGKILHDIVLYTTTEKEADDFIAHFPKYCKLSKGLLGGVKDFNFIVHFPLNHYHFDEKTSGTKNETAIKRVNKIIEVLKSLY